MKLHEACKTLGLWPVGRDVRTEDPDLWRAARNARKAARQTIRRAGGVA